MSINGQTNGTVNKFFDEQIEEHTIEPKVILYHAKPEQPQEQSLEQPVLFPELKNEIADAYTFEDLQELLGNEPKPKTRWMKFKEDVSKMLSGQNGIIKHLVSIPLVISQLISHSSIIGRLRIANDIPNWLAYTIGFLGSSIFEISIHFLAREGKVLSPVIMGIISGMLSMTAYSSFSEQGFTQLLISLALSFFPPYLIYTNARESFLQDEAEAMTARRRELDRVEEENKKAAELKAENERIRIENEKRERRNEKALKLKEPEKKTRITRLTKAAKYQMSKTIIEKNLRSIKAIMKEFQVEKTTAYALRTLADTAKEKVKKKISEPQEKINGTQRNLTENLKEGDKNV